MGPRPPGSSLDRFPNRHGNYEPGNVRWATPQQQADNKDGHRPVEINGESHSVSAWAKLLGLERESLRRWLRSGLTLQDAIAKARAAQERRSPIEWNGRTQSVEAWARELRIPRATLTGRLLKGWPIDKAMTTPSRPKRRVIKPAGKERDVVKHATIEELPSGRFRARKINPVSGKYEACGTFGTEREAGLALKKPFPTKERRLRERRLQRLDRDNFGGCA
jgi:hypothetical protein